MALLKTSAFLLSRWAARLGCGSSIIDADGCDGGPGGVRAGAGISVGGSLRFWLGPRRCTCRFGFGWVPLSMERVASGVSEAEAEAEAAGDEEIVGCRLSSTDETWAEASGELR